jgi:hypothetical protein
MYGLEVMPIKKKEMEQMEIMQRKLLLLVSYLLMYDLSRYALQVGA